MKIEYSKKAVKYINSVDKPVKKRLREAIEKIQEAVPEPSEIEAILEGRMDRAKNGTISHDAINWD